MTFYCRRCGIEVAPKKWYCPECRVQARKEANKRNFSNWRKRHPKQFRRIRRKMRGVTQPVCAKCGKPIPEDEHWSQKYCKKCIPDNRTYMREYMRNRYQTDKKFRERMKTAVVEYKMRRQRKSERDRR